MNRKILKRARELLHESEYLFDIAVEMAREE